MYFLGFFAFIPLNDFKFFMELFSPICLLQIADDDDDDYIPIVRCHRSPVGNDNNMYII